VNSAPVGIFDSGVGGLCVLLRAEHAGPGRAPVCLLAADSTGVMSISRVRKLSDRSSIELLSYAALAASLTFGFSPNRAPLTATCWKISPPITA
jgi:hypothetical protein